MELSLCMIVKNEADVLERAVENARVFADEIVVVDTGSTDGTKAIAKRVADKTGEFKWRDDFAAARNYADSLATCPYKMWLDADDVLLEEDQTSFLALKERLDPAVSVVMAPYHTGFDENGRVTFSYYRERLIKNRAGMSWVGAVHEVVPSIGTVLYGDFAVTHKKDPSLRPGPKSAYLSESAGGGKGAGAPPAVLLWPGALLPSPLGGGPGGL